jgi:hypothetical protein
MTSDIVTLTREQGYALIQLNRPDVLNAISLQMMTDLVAALVDNRPFSFYFFPVRSDRSLPTRSAHAESRGCQASGCRA